MQTYSKDINILKDLNIKLNITENKYGLDIDNFLQLGARQNPKRSFLFVNKFLGKHIPINPILSLEMACLLGQELSNDKMEKEIENKIVMSLNDPNNKSILSIKDIDKIKFTTDKKTLFIGFAETATGLGHSVFSNFVDNSYFVHTTREEIEEIDSAFNFEEEHSHATSHLCYILNNKIFDEIEQIVLIDDEMSTGKTNLNLIKALYEHFPIKNFTCMSILDWRSQEDINKYTEVEKDLNININVISLIKGNFECNNKILSIEEDISKEKSIPEHFDFNIFNLNNVNNGLEQFVEFTVSKTNKVEKFLLGTGKFGLDSLENKLYRDEIVEQFEQLNLSFNNKTIFMGFGEFIYLPMYIAAKLDKDIEFSSPSLSPIYISDKENYPIKTVDKIVCPYNIQKNYHLYNLENNKYKQIVLFLERTPTPEFIQNFLNICINRGIEKINLIVSN